jgi:hypothetical protein
VEKLGEDIGAPPEQMVGDFPGVDDMPRSALELLREFDTRLVAGETLTEFERGQVAVLDAAARGELLLRGELVDDPPPVAIIETGTSPFDSSPIVDDSVVDNDPAPPTARPPVQNADSTAVQARTEPEPGCPYCHQSYARCAEMKADHYPTWRDLHFNHPEERKKRDEYATAVMLKQVKFGHRY